MIAEQKATVGLDKGGGVDPKTKVRKTSVLRSPTLASMGIDSK
jgi:hypothetical protein